MKKLLLFCLLSFVFIGCNNYSSTKDTEVIQSKESLEKTFKHDITKLIECLNKKDWETFWDMTNPKLLDFADKETLTTEIELMMETSDFEFKNLEFGQISEVVSENNFNYCRIFYNYDLFANNEFAQKIESSMIASSKNSYNNWTYIECGNNTDKLMIQQIIPVIDQLK